MFCVSNPNLVILAWTADELSCGQASDWYTHTDTRTDTQTQAMTIPEGQNWPRVINRVLRTRSFINLLYQKYWNHITNSAVNWMTWSITDTELSALTIQKSKIINIVPKTPRAIKKLGQLNWPLSWLFHGLWLYSQYTLPRYWWLSARKM